MMEVSVHLRDIQIVLVALVRHLKDDVLLFPFSRTCQLLVYEPRELTGLGCQSVEVLVKVVHPFYCVSRDFSLCHIQFLGGRFDPVFEGFQVFFVHLRTLSYQLDAVPYFHDDLVLCCGHLVGWYLSGVPQLLVGCGHANEGGVEHLLVSGHNCWDRGWGWLSGRP